MRKARPSFRQKFWAIICIAFIYPSAHTTLMAADESGPSRQQKKAARPQQSSEERLWQIAVDSDKAGAYDAYLRKYPNGRYATLARSRLASMDAAMPQSAPQPKRDEQARASSSGSQLGLSAEEELWKAANASGNASDYQAYLREYPEGRYAAIARSQLAGSSPESRNAAAAPETTQAPQPTTEQEFRIGADAAPGPQKTIRIGDQTMIGNFSVDPQTGKVSGTGRIDWADGNRFEGTLVSGVKQGKGRFSWHNGQRYAGDWANDQPNGKGTIDFANGDRYEGEVKDGQANGQGFARFNSGDSYAGNWVNGKRHGTGRYTWAQGGYWEGEFRNGERTENGTLMRAQADRATAPRGTSGDSSSGLDNKAEGPGSEERP